MLLHDTVRQYGSKVSCLLGFCAWCGASTAGEGLGHLGAELAELAEVVTQDGLVGVDLGGRQQLLEPRDALLDLGHTCTSSSCCDSPSAVGVTFGALSDEP